MLNCHFSFISIKSKTLAKWIYCSSVLWILFVVFFVSTSAQGPQYFARALFNYAYCYLCLPQEVARGGMGLSGTKVVSSRSFQMVLSGRSCRVFLPVNAPLERSGGGIGSCQGILSYRSCYPQSFQGSVPNRGVQVKIFRGVPWFLYPSSQPGSLHS